MVGPPAILAVSAQEIMQAISDSARLTMTDGPAKALLDRLAVFAGSDYDPGDVVAFVVRPSAYSGL